MSSTGVTKLFYFYPRSPCGERQYFLEVHYYVSYISIHALLAESDFGFCDLEPIRNNISIHALLAESDLWAMCGPAGGRTFLSTLSLRRATYSLVIMIPSNFSFLSTLSLRRATLHCNTPITFLHYFYPRSPCGERPGAGVGLYLVTEISIHALLAESDVVHQSDGQSGYISIHALLAESDLKC